MQCIYGRYFFGTCFEILQGEKDKKAGLIDECNPSNSTPDPADGDRDLLHRYRDGQEDAATALYKRYAVRLKRLAEKKTGTKMASRIDPEGIVQSVFRTFFRRVSKGHYEVADGDDLWNLLLVISLNKLRKEATKQRTAKRDISKTQSLLESDANSLAKNDDEAFLVLRLTVEEILSSLSETERTIVELRIEGHDINHIANETKRAKRSVERILQAFRTRLKGAIDDE